MNPRCGNCAPQPTPEGRLAEPPSLDELAERMARASHVIYNRMAAVNGWATQESTRVDFDELPDANRRTMIATEKARLEAGVNLPGPAVLAGIEEAK